VREYTEQHYLPAAKAYLARAADRGAGARKLLDYENAIAAEGAALRFGAVAVETQAAGHVFTVEVVLKNVLPDMVRVELYADGADGGAATRQEMTRGRPLANGVGGFAYGATVSSARPASDYTARLVPRCEGLSVPLESGWILWQK
jgi:starch phosphorylase